MSMQMMMGVVIALGFGAAFFLVSNGFKDPPGYELESEESPSIEEIVSGETESVATNEEMFSNIEAALNANPRNRLRAYKYGAALVGLKEYDRAEKFYLQQLDLFPADETIAYALGCCYDEQKKYRKAIDAYSKAIKIDPQHRESRNCLAWILATAPDEEIRDGAKAVVIARQALGNESPPNVRLMDTLAAAYAEAGSFENAIRVQRYVSQKNEGFNRSIEHRLKLYLEHKPYHMPK